MNSADFDIPFSSQSTEDWKNRVTKELKGKSFSDFLEWRSVDGFKIDSWQDSTDNAPIDLPPLKSPWKLVHPVYNEDAVTANAEALNALMNGAESIWFDKGFLGAAEILAHKDIDTSVAPVFTRSSSIFDVFQEFLKNDVEPDLTQADKNGLINGLRLRERGASIVQEVAYSISQGISLLNSGAKNENIYFNTGIGTSYLAEIAKTRALRLLWSNVLRVSGDTEENPRLIGINLSIDYPQADEYNNILRATTSALSGILGGVEFMMIEPWNRQWSDELQFSSRISRNIQNLIRDEGRLEKNLNAADGSYFLDQLTQQIAKEAWVKVRQIEDAGGFIQHVKAGGLKKELTDSRKQLLDSLKTGESSILGVNKYEPAGFEPELVVTKSSYEHLPNFIHLPSELQQ